MDGSRHVSLIVWFGSGRSHLQRSSQRAVWNSATTKTVPSGSAIPAIFWLPSNVLLREPAFAGIIISGTIIINIIVDHRQVQPYYCGISHRSGYTDPDFEIEYCGLAYLDYGSLVCPQVHLRPGSQQ